MQKKDNSKPSMKKNERKRGRPAGKNRVPLSLDERRARNAQYERERRNETADAMAQLAEAACCDPQITNPDLLATVINRFQNAQAEKSLDDLRRINEDLESQIAALEKRLAEDSCGEGSDLDKRSEKRTTPQSDSDTDRSVEKRRPTKFRKTSKQNTVHGGVRPLSRTSSHECTDSEESHSSNHHLGKTIPSQADPLPTEIEQSIVKREHERISSPYRQETKSRVSEESSSEDEVFSKNSKELETFYDRSHKDVKVQIQFLPRIAQIKPENRTEEHSTDPFTDQEKAILSSLGWGDFSLEGGYSENQRWPHMDYAHY